MVICRESSLTVSLTKINVISQILKRTKCKLIYSGKRNELIQNMFHKQNEGIRFSAVCLHVFAAKWK